MSDLSEKPTTGAGCLLRTYWMLAGNALIAYLALLIIEQKSRLFTFRDILFWLAAGSVLVARYVDVRFMRGETGDGRPATMTNWRRHAAILLIVAGVAWAIARLLVARGG
jgi:hypothetical protein